MNFVGSFPTYRPRRLRQTAVMRRFVSETRLSASQLVLPLFVRPGRKIRRAIQAMPGAADLCRKFSLGYVCSRKWAELDAAGIKLTPRDLGPPGPMPYNPAEGAAEHRVRK